jgi:hypothetical protein
VVIFSSSSPEEIESMPNVVSVVHKLLGVDALLLAVKRAASGVARALGGQGSQGTESLAFARLQK